MVDLAALSMVRDIVAILGVVGGFTYYVMTVRASQRNQRHQLETRQALFLLDLNPTRAPKPLLFRSTGESKKNPRIRDTQIMRGESKNKP